MLFETLCSRISVSKIHDHLNSVWIALMDSIYSHPLKFLLISQDEKNPHYIIMSSMPNGKALRILVQ